MGSSVAWKQFERRICKRFGLVHLGGRRPGPDGMSEWLKVECKLLKGVIPKWLEGALLQATTGAKKTQLPIAIIKEKGKNDDSSLVVMRLKDFEEWFGKTGEAKVV